MSKAAYAYDLNVQKKTKTFDEPKPKLVVIKTNKKAIESKKSKANLVMSVVIVFAMFMIISYRYNVISEKNLEVQKLEKSLIQTKGVLASSEIKLDKAVDMDKVELYSKGQLGMQKPEKNQIVYVDIQNQTSNNSDNSSNILNKVTDLVKGIFSK